jgi:DegV family protein with EDD domain
MSNYVIYTDSGCDISPALLAQWSVKLCELRFLFEGEETSYTNRDMSEKDFYQRMRDGAAAKTSAVNVEEFKCAFEQELNEGNDVLYIAFSSGLSTTYNSARIAAEELQEQHPDRKIMVIDSLAASAGHGLLVYLSVQEKKKGATIEEVAAFAEATKRKLCIWFTVDDLEYLKRGGRVSPTVAFVGGLLGIKPVLFMDNEGHLISRAKVRGRKAAIQALADKFTELAIDKQHNTIFISHGDCEEDATALASIIEAQHGIRTEIITYVGPVIGSHSGPGTLAIFFVGEERK